MCSKFTIIYYYLLLFSNVTKNILRVLPMNKSNLDLFTTYLLSTFSTATATATSLSAMVKSDVSHDQIKRFLSAQDDASKNLWQQVKQAMAQHKNMLQAAFSGQLAPQDPRR